MTPSEFRTRRLMAGAEIERARDLRRVVDNLSAAVLLARTIEEARHTPEGVDDDDLSELLSLVRRLAGEEDEEDE